MFCDSVIMRPERQELLPQFRSFRRRASQIGGDRSNFDLNLLWENIQASKFKNIEKENMKHRKKLDSKICKKYNIKILVKKLKAEFAFFFLPCSLFPPVISSYTIILGSNLTMASTSPIRWELVLCEVLLAGVNYSGWRCC